jgi:hypothetical protein
MVALLAALALAACRSRAGAAGLPEVDASARGGRVPEAEARPPQTPEVAAHSDSLRLPEVRGRRPEAAGHLPEVGAHR